MRQRGWERERIRVREKVRILAETCMMSSNDRLLKLRGLGKEEETSRETRYRDR